MSRQINQPINQVKLTNVAIVRYNYGGKRFEIACYKNKVVDYRNGLETDLSEVLQSERIFVNVSKGEFAKTNDLQSVFHTKNEYEIAKIILEKGNSVQISDLERNHLYEQTMQKIAVWLSENCINDDTKLPYTVHQLKQYLTSGVSNNSYQIQLHKPIKKQYLDSFKFLKNHTNLNIVRCMMELSFVYETKHHLYVQEQIDRLNNTDDVAVIDDNHNGHHQNKNGKLVTNNTSKVTSENKQKMAFPNAKQRRQPIQVLSSTTSNESKSENNTLDMNTTTKTLILHVDPALYRDLTMVAEKISGRIEIMVQNVGANNTTSNATSTATVTTATNVTTDDNHKNSNATASTASDSVDTKNNFIDDDNKIIELTAALDLNHIDASNDASKDDKSKPVDSKCEGNHTNDDVGDDNEDSDGDNSKNNQDHDNTDNDVSDDDIGDDSSVDDFKNIVSSTVEKKVITKKDLRKARKAKNKQILSTIRKNQKHDDFETNDDSSDDDNEQQQQQQQQHRSKQMNLKKSSFDSKNNQTIESEKNKKKNKKKNKGSNNAMDTSTFPMPIQLVSSSVSGVQSNGRNVDVAVASKNTATGTSTNGSCMIQKQQQQQTLPLATAIVAALSCNTCGGNFPTQATYRAHYRTDWHRFNQKLKLQGCLPVSENEFLACDAASFFE